MNFTLSLSDDAVVDLDRLHGWIEERAGSATADAYDRRIRAFIRTLVAFPGRGTPHDQISVGMRTVTFERRRIIAYRVTERRVYVMRVIDGHRDWPSLLR